MFLIAMILILASVVLFAIGRSWAMVLLAAGLFVEMYARHGIHLS